MNSWFYRFLVYVYPLQISIFIQIWWNRCWGLVQTVLYSSFSKLLETNPKVRFLRRLHFDRKSHVGSFSSMWLVEILIRNLCGILKNASREILWLPSSLPWFISQKYDPLQISQQFLAKYALLLTNSDIYVNKLTETIMWTSIKDKFWNTIRLIHISRKQLMRHSWLIFGRLSFLSNIYTGTVFPRFKHVTPKIYKCINSSLVLKLWQYQQMQNSTIYVLFILLSSYMFRYCRHPQPAYTKLRNGNHTYIVEFAFVCQSFNISKRKE